MFLTDSAHFFRPLLDGIFHAGLRRGVEFDDLGDGHGLNSSLGRQGLPEQAASSRPVKGAQRLLACCDAQRRPRPRKTRRPGRPDGIGQDHARARTGAGAAGLAFVDRGSRASKAAPAPTSRPSSPARAKPASASANAKRWRRRSRAQAAVIATGGGAVLETDNRDAMRRQAFVVYLQVDVDEQLARLAGDRGRPLLAGRGSCATPGRPAGDREPLYREVAHLVFDTSALAPPTPQSIVRPLESTGNARRT